MHEASVLRATKNNAEVPLAQAQRYDEVSIIQLFVCSSLGKIGENCSVLQQQKRYITMERRYSADLDPYPPAKDSVPVQGDMVWFREQSKGK